MIFTAADLRDCRFYIIIGIKIVGFVILIVD